MTSTTSRLLTLAAIVLAFSFSQADAASRVTLRRGKLTITGDTAANTIDILIGFSVEVTVDGASDSFDIGDVSQIVINSRGGNDEVSVSEGIIVLDESNTSTRSSLSAPSGPDLSINTAGGNDVVLISGSWGDVQVVTGGGADELYMSEAYISGDTRVRTGSGEDFVWFGVGLILVAPTTETATAPAADLTFAGDVNVGLGGGDDVMFVFGTDFDESVVINANGGTDCRSFSDPDLADDATNFEEDCFGDVAVID